jgi:hypothetical protein
MVETINGILPDMKSKKHRRAAVIVSVAVALATVLEACALGAENKNNDRFTLHETPQRYVLSDSEDTFRRMPTLSSTRITMYSMLRVCIH